MKNGLLPLSPIGLRLTGRRFAPRNGDVPGLNKGSWKPPRWLRRGGVLIAVLYLGTSSTLAGARWRSTNIGSDFAAMTTLNVPFGTGLNWLPPDPYITTPVLFPMARNSALNGVFAFRSVSAPIGASPTTVIPLACPPAFTARGLALNIGSNCGTPGIIRSTTCSSDRVSEWGGPPANQRSRALRIAYSRTNIRPMNRADTKLPLSL